MTSTINENGVAHLSNVDPNAGGSVPRQADAILLLHGPNLNLLGTRDPKTYGTTTLAEVEQRLTKLGEELGVKVICAQTNHEGVYIDMIHYSRCFGAIVMNPGAFCHQSYAIRDAIASINTPVFEIHISNIEAREEWRKSKTAEVCKGVLFGFGIPGYELALRGAAQYIQAAST